MEVKIIKRNGEEKRFCKSKIINAIRKANKEVQSRDRIKVVDIRKIADEIKEEAAASSFFLSVETIQDRVEIKLMERGAFFVAQKYVRYRYMRNLVRKSNTTDQQILSLIECNNEEVKQENSNKNPTICSTQRDYMAGEVSKDITKRFLLPEKIVEAHEDGIIHFHDADYFAQHMHNCFNKNTRFITSEGVKAFKDFKDGETVKVLDKDGVWRQATVRCYGPQIMQKVTLRSTHSKKKIICTPNHRWILNDGNVTTTLCEGMTLAPLKEMRVLSEDCELTKEQAMAFAMGFCLGDGMDHGNYVNIRLCGDKSKFVDVFKMAGYSITYPDSLSGDPMAYKKEAYKQKFLSNEIWRFMSLEDKIYAFLGYYAADGTQNRISTTDERLCNFIEDVSGLAGYHICSKKTYVRDTNYKQETLIYTYNFRKNQNSNNLWKVDSIKPYKQWSEQEAWCVEEPITHSFTLEGGVVTGNCDLVNLEDMLQNGTVISGTLIEKPHRFSTACNITTQIIAQVASSQYGGQSITLTHLAPFVDISRKAIEKELREEYEGLNISEKHIKKITEKRLLTEIRNGVQMIQYQVITLMTTNGQSPFITVFMYLNETDDEQTKADLALIIEEMLKQRILGVKNEKGVYITPSFPKLIYVLEEDNVYPGSKYYDLTRLSALCTIRRMVPDYISEKKMKELKEGNCFAVMGCRSALSVWRDPENDNKPKFYGRFNQGVVTINLVDVACSSEGNMDNFWEIFDERLEDLCFPALMCRHNRLKGTISDVAPILWQSGALARLKKGETIDKLLYGGYSTISLGYAGLYECVKRMTGKSHTDPEAKPFAIAVMKYMVDKCEKWYKKTNIGFSVYGTPLESTTYKFAKCLQNRFGIIPGITDSNYITNSYHVNVRERIDAFEKLKFESEFQSLSTGGAISYVEAPDMSNNQEAVMSLLLFIYDNIMYAEMNGKFDYCHECGYHGEIKIVKDKGGKLVWECPCCGNRDESKMNVARRTCGYIGENFWNQGRTGEINDRVLHFDNMDIDDSTGETLCIDTDDSKALCM